ncbi:trypco2 family protein [Micromonospora sp. M12]
MTRKGGLDLADAIEELRRELTLAQTRAASAEIRFPINAVSVELRAVATTDIDGRAGFKIPVIEAELGGAPATRARPPTPSPSSSGHRSTPAATLCRSTG